jgi:hypothetical protein
MSFKANPLSLLGRVGWGVHFLVYPSIGLAYLYGVKPILAQRAAAQDERDWAGMPKIKPVDPDIFNPFTPIPYHNNKELTYAFANVKMHNHINKNHINPETYVWKDFHNSFDHEH